MSGTKVEGPSTLVRPKFGPGMLLQSDDLDQLAVYTRDLNRLMFRSLFGCGVVCGLVVTPETKCGAGTITVGAGLALDCSGDPIYVPKDQSLVIDDTCAPTTTPVWVVLCGKTKNCAPRTAMCATDQDETTSICTRERDGFEIRVVTKEPHCACNCIPPTDDEQSCLPEKTIQPETSCLCADPTLPCLQGHYCGHCDTCGCGDCGDCGGGCSDADCVVLARLGWDEPKGKAPQWNADHSVRRFIRPVLMRDPQAAKERIAAAAQAKADQEAKDQLFKEMKDHALADHAAAVEVAAALARAKAAAHPAEAEERRKRRPRGSKTAT